MLLDELKNYRIILASGSPRRKQLLQELGLSFEVRVPQVDESYPDHLQKEEIAKYISRKKAYSFDEKDFTGRTILIAADTIVCLDQQVLAKPENRNEAYSMISLLSGNSHDVITGVTVRSESKSKTFCSETRVFFKHLSKKEIDYYIDVYKPYDKAGAYGIQEWIGYAGIERIEGSYFNVMGLPVQKLYERLENFIQ